MDFWYFTSIESISDKVLVSSFNSYFLIMTYIENMKRNLSVGEIGLSLFSFDLE